MGSRTRRLGPESPSRARIDNRETPVRGRRYEEPPHLRGREGRFNFQVRKESSTDRNYKETANIREREGPPKVVRSRERSPDLRNQESARDRIRRENKEHERSRERSRSHSRRYSPGHRQSRERHPSRGHVSRSSERRGRSAERKVRSMERQGHSAERKSEVLRFEPPDHRPHKGGFDLRQRSPSKDRRARYSPPHEDVQFVEEGPCMSNRFSPPAPERFHDVQFNKEEFDPRYNYNQDSFREMSESNMPLNGPPNIGGPIINNQGFPPNQNFVPQQNLLVNPQPLMGKQEFPPNPIINPEFSHNPNDQGFPPIQSSFLDKSFQGFSGQGRIEGGQGRIEGGQGRIAGGLDNGEDPLIPDFNPETSKLSSHEWVKLIDEAARQHDWKRDEKQYIMASRLSGFARQWYLTSGVNCKGWGDLRQAFLNTFPTEMGFHAILTKMLARIKEENESMASYFHHKVALLNACEILGRKAVSCIIAGLPTVKLRLQAKSQNFEDPDELYLYLRSFDPEPPVKKQQKNAPADDSKNKNAKAHPSTKHCFFCGSVGHMKYQCPQYKLKMEYQSEDNDKESGMPHNNKVMHGSLSRKPAYPKYFADASINGILLKAYVDQGSECTTIREENAILLKLPIKKQYKVIRGFAGSALSSIGFVDTVLCIDRAVSKILLFVVPDHLQAIPIVVGQSFTEQPHVVVMKDGDKIRFYQRMDNGETNFDF